MTTMMLNQNGDPIQDECLYSSWATPGLWCKVTEEERDQAIALLCAHLKVAVWRTNCTKHGNVELVLWPDC